MIYSERGNSMTQKSTTGNKRRWVANTSIVNMPARHQTPRIKAEANMDAASDLIQLRHPDPALTPKLELKAPSLQVLGSWAKIPVKSPARVLVRFGFTSFVWKSRLEIKCFWESAG
jgi:hypothetical protein